MSTPLSAQGTLLQIGDGGEPEVFTTIARVQDITGPGLTADVADVTTHDTSGWREQLSLILAAGDVTFDVFFLPTHATHSPSSGVLQDYLNRTLRNFMIVLTDAGAMEITFEAYVTSFSISAPVANPLEASVTLSVTGAVTFTP